MSILPLLRCSVLAIPLLTSVAAAQDYYAAFLDGAQEVPAVATAGRGWAVIRHDLATDAVRIFVHHEGLTSAPTAGHLHLGAAGSNGGVVFGLAPVGGSAFTGQAVLSAANVAALQTAGTYLNLHTPANPGGEVRGQVVPASSTRFAGMLEGGQEVPPVTSTSAGGSVTAFLHQPDNRIVYIVEGTGLAAATAAHIHRGAAGSNGPVIAALTGGGGVYCGVTERLATGDLAALLADGCYVNVHTPSNPGGEARAQLLADQGDHFVVQIDGAQTTPATGSAGFGGASLIRQPDGTLVLAGGFAGLTGTATVAHVHIAPAGANGGVVFPLTVGAGGELDGSFSPSAADLVALRAGDWYINVHSTTSPGGEIRGQLLPADLPTPFGGGCEDSGGRRAQSGGSGVAAVGAPMSLDLYGALPGSIQLLAFGSNRDQFAGAVALPLELTAAGINSPGCYLLVDPIVVLVEIADGMGCAGIAIDIPVVPALRATSHVGQWVGLDPAANPGGFVSSSATSFRIQ